MRTREELDKKVDELTAKFPQDRPAVQIGQLAIITEILLDIRDFLSIKER